MIRWLFGAALGLAVLAAAADPSPQLVASVQARLPHYGLSTDVSQFATPTVVALYFALQSSDPYLKKKRRLKSILRNPKYK